jgi:hypothetical protein
MMKTIRVILCLALMCVLHAAAGAAPVGTFTTSTSQNAFPVSSSDLVEAGASTLSAVNKYNYVEWLNFATINNGLSQSQSTGALCADSATSWTVEFVLNGTAGYDITQIVINNSWSAGRAGMNATVAYSTVADPVTFVSLGNYQQVLASGGTTRLALTDTTGLLAGSVRAIRVTFGKDPDPSHYQDVIQEVDVFGVPANNASSVVGTITVGDGWYGGAGWSLSGTDLVNAGATTLSAVNAYNFTAWSPLANINNGQWDNGTLSADGTNWTVEFVLNTTANTAGYDITQIVINNSWTAGRAGMNATVAYSTVAAPTTFVSLGNYQGTNTYGYGTTKLDLTDSTGILAGGVKAIRVTFGADPYYNYQDVVQEVDIYGVPAGTAFGPSPADGGLAGPNAGLSWWQTVTPGAGNGYHVYLGASAGAVSAATIGSPEYEGFMTDSAYDPGTLSEGNSYYWRIDSVENGRTVPGPVWSFFVNCVNMLDLDGDCEINLGDLLVLAGNWLGAGLGDLNASGKVDMVDFAELAANPVTLVQNGQPNAKIVVAQTPTPSANFAALELRYHIKRITGVELPMVSDSQTVTGNRILVGHSAATAALGISVGDFNPLEYRVQIDPGTIVLIGRDWQDTPANRAEAGHSVSGYTLQSAREVVNYNQVTGGFGPSSIELPGLFDEQGTCYAVYDFLERFCGVRWYGPTELNVVSPSTETLAVTTGTIQRSKDFKLVDGFGGGWPVINKQWNHPSDNQLAVYWRRLRAGGERWSSNHTINAATMTPPDGIYSDPSFKAVNSSSQLCYTNPALINYVAQVAIAYFRGDYAGQQLPAGLQAMGDYFAFVPEDTGAWCNCTRWGNGGCAAVLNISGQDHRGDGYFANAANSYYIFNFVNEVAKIVGQVYPNKYIAPLAYWSYYYKPLNLQLVPNIAVAPCIGTCYTYVPDVFNNELAGYNEWVADSHATGRRLYMWNYFHHPMEPAVINGFNAFPAFIPHAVSTEVKRYINDGVRGVYLCGIGEQLDYYIYMKTAFDKTTDVDALMDEFFTRYFGAAGEPLKQFYLRVEQINQTEGILGTDIYKSWGKLGTPVRMAELEGYINQALALSVNAPPVLQQRVNTWKVGVWDYMKAGFDAFDGTGMPTFWNASPDDDPYTVHNFSGGAAYINWSAIWEGFNVLYESNQENTIGWDRTAEGGYNNMTIEMYFRANSGDGSFSVVMLNTGDFGTAGVCPMAANPAVPSLSSTFGFGFNLSNHEIAVGWNNGWEGGIPRVSSFNFTDGQQHQVVIEIENDNPNYNSSGGAYITLTIDGTKLWDRAYMQGMHPYESRAGIIGKTGSGGATLNLDHLHIQYFNRVN